MTESKKVWVEPELIVLVRNKPEEAVLTFCKGIGAGPTVGAVNCIGGTESCSPCATTGASS
jgi:hypothetical protein